MPIELKSTDESFFYPQRSRRHRGSDVPDEASPSEAAIADRLAMLTKAHEGEPTLRLSLCDDPSGLGEE